MGPNKFHSNTDKAVKKNRVFFDFLQNNSHFSALCAIRMIPGFPHSVINYGSGILQIHWFRFLSATVVGFAVKGFVYSSAIHKALDTSGVSEAVDLKALWPLLILAALMLGGHVFQRFLTSGRQSGK